MEEYLSKYAGLKQLGKAMRIATKRGSVKDGAIVGGLASTPAAMLAGASMTTMPVHLQKGSIAAAGAIAAGGAAAGAVANTAVQTGKVLKRAKNIKTARKS